MSTPTAPCLSASFSAELRSTTRHYRISDLGTDDDGSPLLPVAINDRGEICVSVASRRPPGVVRGYHLRPSARVACGIAFGEPPVTCLSNEGHTGGVVGTAPKALRAWASHLGPFGERFWPDSTSSVRGINGSGSITGNVMFDVGEFMFSRAFVCRDGRLAEFVLPPGGGTTFATGINDRGEVIFNASAIGDTGGEAQAWLLGDGSYHEIPGLGGRRTWASAISPCGFVVGHSVNGEGETGAFLWDKEETVDLGTVGHAMSHALGVNDRRTVVGRIVSAFSPSEAFVWTPEHGMALLKDQVELPAWWTMRQAVGVNRAGHIIGTGTMDGAPRGFVLRPSA